MTDEPEVNEPRMVELVATPQPKPPGPGFWAALMWCALFLCVLYGAMIFTLGSVWFGEGIASGDLPGFMNQEQDSLEKSAKAGRNELPQGVAAAVAWGMFAGQVAALLAVLLLIRLYVGKGWCAKLAIRRPPLFLMILALLATPGLMILHGAVHELVHAAFGVKPDGSMGPMLKSMFAGWPAFFAVLTIGICPGVLEELFCRGFLGRGLVARYGFVGGVLLTSMMFGFLHIMPLYALGTMFMGISLHFTYIMTRSLWVPILIHAFNNSVTILATLGTIRLDAAEQDAAGLDVWVYTASIASVVFLFAALWTGRIRSESSEASFATVEATAGELRGGTPNFALAALGIAATAALLLLIFA